PATFLASHSVLGPCLPLRTAYPNCADKPVFTPSSLMVKYGDPISVKCSVCQNCHHFGLEVNVGNIERDGTLISWSVDHLTEWGLSPICYYTAEASHQCCSYLPVTLYKLPDNVGLNITGNSWVMSEGQNIILKCSVQNVAPVENLRVTFYSGQRQIGQKQSNSRAFRPVSETFELDFSPTKEDDGGEFWCEAELLLGPDGPQPPPVVKSQNFPFITFHYKIGLKQNILTKTICYKKVPSRAQLKFFMIIQPEEIRIEEDFSNTVKRRVKFLYQISFFIQVIVNVAAHLFCLSGSIYDLIKINVLYFILTQSTHR
uniref:Ig-like domain-containing protein n=1 Tax=Sparus aurata TaxID=8175 RepID=A0A671TQ35_SPAAU